MAACMQWQNVFNFAPAFVNRKRSLKDRGVAQLASVLAWGARGREFESHHSDGPLRETGAVFLLLLKPAEASVAPSKTKSDSRIQLLANRANKVLKTGDNTRIDNGIVVREIFLSYHIPEQAYI